MSGVLAQLLLILRHLLDHLTEVPHRRLVRGHAALVLNELLHVLCHL